MKYGLLTYDIKGEIINIGDYIQSLAAKQFIDKDDDLVYINREELDAYKGEKVFVIMNGWFMENPMRFPPSQFIVPYFISFHINEKAKDIILSASTIDYLKKHEPIGCRDTYTVALLSSKGIQCYFSGCLTLTLGLNYTQTSAREKIYFVDPYIGRLRNCMNLMGALWNLVIHTEKICSLVQFQYGKRDIISLLRSALFYRQYSKIWPDDVLLHGVYITHYVKNMHNGECFKYADDLLNKYANARLIITSRIHAALPALAIGSPCVFVYPSDFNVALNCRFGGLLELLTVERFYDRKRFRSTI